MTGKLLKLRAKDAEDMQVISAVLQDAIAPVCDMAYRPEEKDFVMVVHRFCREDRDEAPMSSCFERVCCAVHVRGVESAQLQGIDPANRDTMLDLLAVMPEAAAVAVARSAEQSRHTESLQFVFAGGGKIRLGLGDWSMIIEDFGEPWPTTHKPVHPDNA